MKLLDAQAAGLDPGAADNGDGTFSRLVDPSAYGERITMDQALATGLVPSVTSQGDGTFSEKVKFQ